MCVQLQLLWVTGNLSRSRLQAGKARKNDSNVVPLVAELKMMHVYIVCFYIGNVGLLLENKTIQL
jgi:hypothetical protein